MEREATITSRVTQAMIRCGAAMVGILLEVARTATRCTVGQAKIHFEAREVVTNCGVAMRLGPITKTRRRLEIISTAGQAMTRSMEEPETTICTAGIGGTIFGAGTMQTISMEVVQPTIYGEETAMTKSTAVAKPDPEERKATIPSTATAEAIRCGADWVTMC
jgi:hypothetical protein